MHIIKKKTLAEYISRHPQAATALQEWYHKVRTARWRNFADVRATFGSADAVGNQHYVFNIKGNDYRLIVVIQFTPGYVYIRFVGTHAEYDKIQDASTI